MTSVKNEIRNEQIVAMINGGKTRTAAANHFGLSLTRVCRIYNRWYDTHNGSDPDLEVYRLCLRYADNVQLAGLVYNRIRTMYAEKNDLYNAPNHISIEDFRTISLDDFTKYRYVGTKAIEVFNKMKADI